MNNDQPVTNEQHEAMIGNLMDEKPSGIETKDEPGMKEAVEACCVVMCHEPRFEQAQACERHWKEYSQISKSVMANVNNGKSLEGFAENVDWDVVRAQYVIPLGIEFPIGKVTMKLVGIKNKHLTLMPVNHNMTFKKAQAGERFARLVQLEEDNRLANKIGTPIGPIK